MSSRDTIPAPAGHPATTPHGDGRSLPAGAGGLKDWQRRRAEARAALVGEVERHALVVGVRTAIAAVASLAAAGELPDDVQAMAAHAGGVSERNLWRWRSRSRRGIDALAPRGREADLPAWGPALLDLWQTPQKRSLSRILADLERRLPDSAPRPSYHQARRFLQRLSAVERERGRRGPRKLKEIRPCVRRDASVLAPCDCYIADGHTFDAEVAHPRHGRPFRPELTIVIDIATRKVVGWSVDLAESTWAVADALRHAVETHGVPAIWYADRGPGHENHALERMLARLHIQRERSRPYNSQARGIVERFNRHLVDAAKLLPTYLGSDMDAEAKARAHKLTRRDVKAIGASRLLLAWPAYLRFVADVLGAYNARPHSGLKLPAPAGRRPATSNGAREALPARAGAISPDAAWQAWLDAGFEPHDVSAAEAADLFRPYEIRQVRRGEVQLFGGRYFDGALEPYHGDDVQVGYDLHDASRVWVRDLEGRLICVAGLDANLAPYFPQSRIEQAREQREAGRLRRLETHAEEIRAERRGGAIEHAGLPPELEDLRAQRIERRAARDAEPAPDAGEVVALFRDEADEWWARACRLERILDDGGELDHADARWLAAARESPWYKAAKRSQARRARTSEAS